VSEKNLKSVNIWQSYKQDRGCLMHFARLANTMLKDEESARYNQVLACNFTKYSPILNSFHSYTQHKAFLIWLLITPPHLKYALPCNLSLRACFADINVSQGSVATYARCDEIINIHLTVNLPSNLPAKNF